MEIKLFWQDVLLATLEYNNYLYNLKLATANFKEAEEKNCPRIYFEILEEEVGKSTQLPPFFMNFIPKEQRGDIYSLFNKKNGINLMESLIELSVLDFPEDGINILRKHHNR